MQLDDQVGAAVAVVRRILGADLEAAYLYGSSVVGGLKPASDVDLFVVSRRSTTAAKRRALVDGLTPLSDRRVRPPTWRPIELTIVVTVDIKPWGYPARTDFQWGEWLRAEFEAGHGPEPRVNPDLAVLCEQVRRASRNLIGASAAEVLDPVPHADVVRAMRDSIPALLDELRSDTANVLLTLARIWHTVSTTEFTSKDAAAVWAQDRLPVSHQRALEHARGVYVGAAADIWVGMDAAIRRTAELVVREIESAEPT